MLLMIIEVLPIELFLAVAVGLNAVALLLSWLQRKAGLPASSRDMSEAQDALRTAQVELPPRALGERIFASPDWDFISIQSPMRIQRMFLQERKAVALSWLRQTRKQVRQLRRFHRGTLRENLRPSAAVGVRLAIDAAWFRMVCDTARLLIWLGGPFWARRMARHVTSVAEQMAYLPGRLLVGLDARRMSRIKNDWLRRSAAA